MRKDANSRVRYWVKKRVKCGKTAEMGRKKRSREKSIYQEITDKMQINEKKKFVK